MIPLTTDSIVTELTAKLTQLQALADQVSEQDSLPLRLQEQLGALWAAQQANFDPEDDSIQDPPTPKSTQSRHHTSSLSAVGLSPQDDTPLFSSSPLAPDPPADWALASSTGPSPGRSIGRSAQGGRGGFGGVSPGCDGLVRSPENEGDGVDVVALRSENSQLRAELARAGRVNEIWGKELLELRRRLGISVDELQALDDSNARGPFASTSRNTYHHSRPRRPTNGASRPRSSSRDLPSTAGAAIAIPGAASPPFSSSLSPPASRSPHSTSATPSSRRLSMSSFGSTLSSGSSRGVGWSAVTTPSTSYAVPGVPLNSPAVRNSMPLGRGGNGGGMSGGGLDEASLTGALLMVGGFSRRGSASSTSALPVPGPSASTSRYSRPLDDDDLAPTTLPASTGAAAAHARVTPSALAEGSTGAAGSGAATPGSSSLGNEAATAGVSVGVAASGLGRSFVAEEGVLRRARGASLSAVEGMGGGRAEKGKGKGRGREG